MTIGKVKSNKIAIEGLLFVVFIIIFQTGTRASLLFDGGLNWTRIYFPTLIGIILVQWFGLRVLIPLYINALFSASLWGIISFAQSIIFALPETTFVFLSWLLFARVMKGKCWLPDIRQALTFLFSGILIPLTIYVLYIEIQFYLFSYVSEIDTKRFSNIWLAEFISVFIISIPFLHFLSRYVSKWKYSILFSEQIEKLPLPMLLTSRLKDVVIFILPVIFLIVFTFILDFLDYWFVFGVLTIIIAVKWGFAYAIITNIVIFLNIYVIRFFFINLPTYQTIVDDETKVYLAVSLLFIASYIIGRVITDKESTELELQRQNASLRKVNEELDRFAYSVSHELSAPLKSILGLAYLANIESDPYMIKRYLEHIEDSTNRMEEFISEVLDFYKNAKSKTEIKNTDIRTLLKAVINNYRFHMDIEDVDISIDLEIENMNSDELRLRIIFNNLISNAIKYRRNDVKSYLKIASWKQGSDVFFTFEDNGQGMDSLVMTNIFRIFYRGNEKSIGSGLGLYLVKESLNKLNGSISVNSTPDTGTVFKIQVPDVP